MSQVLCRVVKSPMAHEVSILIRGVAREYESGADTRDVEVIEGEIEREARGLVPVRIIQEEAAAGRVLVELPMEVIMGSRRVWVPITEVRR
jgi:hypothetical protein